ncbi:DUF1934 domain-containing protein [Ferviditalea candida]|uniref:DUF1934 domain-containing protein n=1 Tax=Ferviditalea candida TaxID=3108399 RepID=A0ABU5ZH77_9BACL|nr:DUF1934 domain-containing protein [Paenibacillaceae bacterium T2]
MPTKRWVNIRIESDSGDERTQFSAKGELYIKKDTTYLRYEETDSSDGKTMNTLKLMPGELLRIIRRGEIESDLNFVPNERTLGIYSTGYGRMEFDVYTHKISFSGLQQGMGNLSWHYDLFEGENLLGSFKITMDITPAD